MDTVQMELLNIWDVVSSSLDSAREAFLRFGSFTGAVYVLLRGREPDIYALPKENRAEFYREMETLANDPNCMGIGQIQVQKFSIADVRSNAIAVSFFAENIGRIGMVQPFRKRKEQFIFEVPFEISERSGGLESGDYIWHHIADRWTTPETIAYQRS
jgi:hypothetical protein